MGYDIVNADYRTVKGMNQVFNNIDYAAEHGHYGFDVSRSGNFKRVGNPFTIITVVEGGYRVTYGLTGNCYDAYDYRLDGVFHTLKGAIEAAYWWMDIQGMAVDESTAPAPQNQPVKQSAVNSRQNVRALIHPCSTDFWMYIAKPGDSIRLCDSVNCANCMHHKMFCRSTGLPPVEELDIAKMHRQLARTDYFGRKYVCPTTGKRDILVAFTVLQDGRIAAFCEQCRKWMDIDMDDTHNPI